MFEPAEPSQQKESNNIRCMICNRMENQRTLFAHISEHIGLKPHSCEHCDFQTGSKFFYIWQKGARLSPTL